MIIFIEKTKLTEISYIPVSGTPQRIKVAMARKPINLHDLERAKLDRTSYTTCIVVGTFVFNGLDWNKFTMNMNITIRGIEQYGGGNPMQVVKCIGPKNYRMPPIYVNSEGFDYARYAGFEVV
jgi:hypothetical protein